MWLRWRPCGRLSPAFCGLEAAEFGAMVRTKYIQGNVLAQPITGFMVTIGAVGYFIEYAVFGRYHVAHKKEKTAAALKGDVRSTRAPQ